MQSLELNPSCPECSVRLLDAGDELVCPGCGVTKGKEVLDEPLAAEPRPQDAVRVPLGSYMGAREPTAEDRSTRGIAANGNSYRYLKLVSDFAGREEDSAVACARLIERVGEKLCLPGPVLVEAAATASRVLAKIRSSRRITVAAVSAYSLITASRVAGVTSVSVREILDAHVALGKRVSSSSLIQLSIESPVKTFARGPQDYLSRVVARLSMNSKLSKRLEKDGVQPTGYLNALREAGRELIMSAGDTATLGKRPCAVAASALYSAEVVLSASEGRNRRVTQRDLALCGETSEYTVRDQCSAIFAPVVERLIARNTRTLPPPPAC